MYDISRATGLEQERIRTEQSINWLSGKTLIHPFIQTNYTQIVYNQTLHDFCLFLNSDPEFVSSAFIQEDEKNNPTGEDDKIYFFFTEVAKEYDLYAKVKVPRVARVCKV